MNRRGEIKIFINIVCVTTGKERRLIHFMISSRLITGRLKDLKKGAECDLGFFKTCPKLDN